MKVDWVVFRRISILAVIREMRTFQTLVLIFVCIIHSYSQEAEVVKCANCEYLYTSDYEFDFESIDSVAFKSFKENYIQKVVYDATRIIINDSLFTIKTQKGNRTFNMDYGGNSGRRGFTWTEYKGFIPSLKCYVLNEWSISEFTFGTSFLIDSLTQSEFRFQSLYDGPNEPPVISPQNAYLISYANSIFDSEGACRISLVKINSIENELDFSGYLYFESNDWTIDEIVWITEHSFALKVNSKEFNEENQKWEEHFEYLQTSFE